MVVKVYVSGISGNKEVKKRQQRVLMILDSKNIKYEVIDITEPGKESDKDFMQNNSKSNGGTVSDPSPRSPLPPQLFNDEEYCGDYDQFDLANEIDTLEQFLKLEVPPEQPEIIENDQAKTLNGDVANTSKENSQEREDKETDKPAQNETETSPAEETSTDGTSDQKVSSKEVTPARDDEADKDESTKEKSPEKETSPERQKSVEKESTPAKDVSPVKEVIEPETVSEKVITENESVNENGPVSSRGHSEDKDAASDVDTTNRKKEPSELLIESEQAVAAE